MHFEHVIHTQLSIVTPPVLQQATSTLTLLGIRGVELPIYHCMIWQIEPMFTYCPSSGAGVLTTSFPFQISLGPDGVLL